MQTASSTAAQTRPDGRVRDRFTPEFRLLLACLRFPFDEEALERVRTGAAKAANWQHFFAVVQRHRVGGLVLRALQSAAVSPPAEVHAQLKTLAGTEARQSLALAIESVRLHRMFAGAAVPVTFLKGAALTALAYSEMSLRHAKDIDLLTDAASVPGAVDVLLRAGYVPVEPQAVDPAHQHLWIRFGKAVDWYHPQSGAMLELHWQLTDLPLLHHGLLPAEAVPVTIMPGANLPSLTGDTLLAYLCVHGAAHGWGRLKWLADVYALLPHNDANAVEALWRRTHAMDAGRAVTEALLLCRDLFDLEIGRAAYALEDDAILRLLRASALGTLRGGNESAEVTDQRFGTTRVYFSRFLLGSGTEALWSEWRTWAYRPADVAESRLPPYLFFLLPVVRLSQWLSARARHGGRSEPTHR